MTACPSVAKSAMRRANASKLASWGTPCVLSCQRANFRVLRNGRSSLGQFPSSISFTQRPQRWPDNGRLAGKRSIHASEGNRTLPMNDFERRIPNSANGYFSRKRTRSRTAALSSAPVTVTVRRIFFMASEIPSTPWRHLRTHRWVGESYLVCWFSFGPWNESDVPRMQSLLRARTECDEDL